MKKTKIWILTATSLILMGLIIFGSVMTMLKWDFTKLSTAKYETNKHTIDENYKNITIITDTADIEFIPTKTCDSQITCQEHKKIKHSVSIKDDTLEIKVHDTRKWYEHIGIFWGERKITVAIPQGDYGKLSMKSSTGNTTIPNDFKFENIDIKGSTGNITNYASATENITIKTTTGDIKSENISGNSLDFKVSTGNISLKNAICNDELKIDVSTGKSHLSDVKCKSLISSGNTGDFSLSNVIAEENFSIKRTTGNIIFENCDAKELNITTDTGDVKGTLLSNKIFFTKTDTGKINIPKTVDGGKCEIETDTGDIKIDITPN